MSLDKSLKLQNFLLLEEQERKTEIELQSNANLYSKELTLFCIDIPESRENLAKKPMHDCNFICEKRETARNFVKLT